MNCCDEYGNCRQGRDCPVRKLVYKPRKKFPARWAVVFFILYTGLLLTYQLLS